MKNLSKTNKTLYKKTKSINNSGLPIVHFFKSVIFHKKYLIGFCNNWKKSPLQVSFYKIYKEDISLKNCGVQKTDRVESLITILQLIFRQASSINILFISNNFVVLSQGLCAWRDYRNFRCFNTSNFVKYWSLYWKLEYIFIL